VLAVWHGIGQLVGLALVVMGLSHSIARERIGAGLRAFLGGRDTWLGYMVSCPYCVSHWIALVLVPITGIYPLEVALRWGLVTQILRWMLSSILVATVATFLRVVFYFVDETQGLVRRQQKMVEQQTVPDNSFQSPRS